MNSTEDGLANAIANAETCWNAFSGTDTGRNKSAIAAMVMLLVVAVLNAAANTWCAVVMLSTPKLQKSTWLFKGSMAIKDALLTVGMASYGLWNLLPLLAGGSPAQATLDAKSNAVDPVAVVFNVVYVTCLAASFMHMLVICLDRHQVISRPFRYHTGDLLPPKIAWVLIASVWTVCLVIGLSVTSESLETNERLGLLRTAGVLFPVYRMPGVQKCLLLGGMTIVYCLTMGLLCTALQIEFRRSRARKEELLSGIGAPEPLRSRNNSVMLPHKSKSGHGGARDSLPDSESDANEFLLSGGGGGFAFGGKDFAALRPLSRPWQTVDENEAAFFTPVNYRPSLLRRIRDTWSLYSATMCFVGFTLTTVLPFLVISLATPTNPRTDAMSLAYCVGSILSEYLFVAQGICYVTLYIITDDVFRPFYTKPLRRVRCQAKTDLTSEEGIRPVHRSIQPAEAEEMVVELG